MANDNLKAIWRAGSMLAFFALVGVVLLVVVQWLTKDQIAENARLMKLQRLHEIVSAADYNNDLLASAQTLPLSIEGLADTAKKYTASKSGTAIADIYEVTSLQGYSGPISLVIGINADNSLRGVRVISHKETPGLGDKIETSKDDWILQFAGKSLQNPELNRWKVRKDGGDFDQFTGATITPRAVVNAVREVLSINE
ncbi:electron transport complex subunit RsxG [Leucothrix pacifica]|uniref:Ion-translocating oxidoreductase complex subunit G n=1 Tax=Leucothrix pacifica TaxID=1247513 RepID=A0A317C236_9GAMM|nr:electron transport complex subunit RsxG [Leucothrix pacifica]PWQ92427.1 electron transport complex subunit RsxG [Leucothrix pacifica]